MQRTRINMNEVDNIFKHPSKQLMSTTAKAFKITTNMNQTLSESVSTNIHVTYF